jgi:hypothetical protein
MYISLLYGGLFFPFGCVVLPPELLTSHHFIFLHSHYLAKALMGSAAGAGISFRSR